MYESIIPTFEKDYPNISKLVKEYDKEDQKK